MKKIYALAVSILTTAAAFAQSAEDGLTLSVEEYEGTARTMAMGNAFTALGGDLGAIGINPASTGLFRCSQFTITPSITGNSSQTDYLGEMDREKFNRLGLSNMGYVAAFDTGKYTGLLNYNFGIVYNRKNNFNYVMGAAGLTDQSSYLGSLAVGSEGVNYQTIESDGYYGTAPWTAVLGYDTYLLDLDGDCDDAYIGATENVSTDALGNRDIYTGGKLGQSYFRKVRGGVEEYAFNFGGNVSDKLYFGVNLNMLSVSYEEQETYSEEAADPSCFDTGFSSMTHKYSRTTIGSGVSMKVGAIYAPFRGFRVGATVSTPTLYSLTDSWMHSMQSVFDSKYTDGNHPSTYEESPMGYYEYEVKAPWRWSAGASYVFGKKGLVSIDYEGVNYSGITMRDYDGNPNEFSDENSYIRKHYGSAYVLRAGGEVWILDNLAIRCGYTRYSSPGDYVADKQYTSWGFGWRINRSTTLDFAWQNRASGEEEFQLYGDYSGIEAPEGNITCDHHKAVITLGFKF